MCLEIHQALTESLLQGEDMEAVVRTVGREKMELTEHQEEEEAQVVSEVLLVELVLLEVMEGQVHLQATDLQVLHLEEEEAQVTEVQE
jgi:hypothetical protein